MEDHDYHSSLVFLADTNVLACLRRFHRFIKTSSDIHSDSIELLAARTTVLILCLVYLKEKLESKGDWTDLREQMKLFEGEIEKICRKRETKRCL